MISDDYLPEYYVSYRSNLNIEQMVSRCPGALLIETDLLCDRALAIKGPDENRGYLTLVPSAGSKVHVALWKITRKDKEALDRYEDVGHLYEIEHLILGGKKCFCYVMKSIFPSARPTEQYMELCKKGYEENGFDPLYLESALRRY